MSTMGRYCKAYPVKRLRSFPGWQENPLQSKSEDGQEAEPTPRRTIADEDYLFLQENLTVTDGIFLDENVVFESSLEEWRTFCHEELQFQVPSYIAGDAGSESGSHA